MEKSKIYSRVDKSVDDSVNKMAKNYGMTKSAVIALCLKIGLTYLKVVTEPEGLITPELMAEVMVEAEKRGVEFKVPDELAE